MQSHSFDWLRSQADVYAAAFILLRWLWHATRMWWGWQGMWGGPDRWQRLRSSQPVKDDLSPADRPQPVIYLLTALMWVKWAGGGGEVTRGKDKVSGYRKEKSDRPFLTSKYQQEPLHTSQWACQPRNQLLAAFWARNQICKTGTLAISSVGVGQTNCTCHLIIWSALNFLHIEFLQYAVMLLASTFSF